MNAQVGQNVEAMLLSVDLKLGRVELSIRRTMPDPRLAAERDDSAAQAEEGERDLAAELGTMPQVCAPMKICASINNF